MTDRQKFENSRRISTSIWKRVRGRLRERAEYYRFEKLRELPQRCLHEIFPGIEATNCAINFGSSSSAILGNISDSELISVSTLCAFLKPQMICEFGTFDGRTTLHLALNSPEHAKITTVDLSPDDPIRNTTTSDTFYTQKVEVGNRFRGTINAKKITQVYADTTKYDTSALEGRVDLMFVDAGHAYELVRSDSAKALRMVKPGGVILWHDYSYGHPGVYTCHHELAKSIHLIHITNTTLVCHIKPEV